MRNSRLTAKTGKVVSAEITFLKKKSLIIKQQAFCFTATVIVTVPLRRALYAQLLRWPPAEEHTATTKAHARAHHLRLDKQQLRNLLR